jgi:hypothetical protein
MAVSQTFVEPRRHRCGGIRSTLDSAHNVKAAHAPRTYRVHVFEGVCHQA